MSRENSPPNWDSTSSSSPGSTASRVETMTATIPSYASASGMAEFGDRIEVRVRPAAGDKGTELSARLRDRPSSGAAPRRLRGTDPQAELRSALRQAKQLLDVGEALAVDPAPMCALAPGNVNAGVADR